MESFYENFEVVHVIREFRLIDEESYERVYSREDGRPLEVGWYVVNWPASVTSGRFDAHARFHGPFAQFEVAHRARELMAERARALNIKTKLPALLLPACPSSGHLNRNYPGSRERHDNSRAGPKEGRTMSRVLIATHSNHMRKSLVSRARGLTQAQVIAIPDPLDHVIYRALDLHPDVLVVSVPGIGTDELAPLRRIPAILPGTRILVVTADTEGTDAERCYTMGEDLALKECGNAANISTLLRQWLPPASTERTASIRDKLFT